MSMCGIISSMRNLTISLDERTLDECRKYARDRGMSMNALIREAILRTISLGAHDKVEEAFALADKLNLKSEGPWKRDELYDSKRVS